MKFEKFLRNLSDKFSKNVPLNIVGMGMALIMPFMVVGAISALLTGMQIEAYQTFITNTGLIKILSIPNQYTTNFISIYIVFAVAYNAARKLGNKKNDILTGLIGIFAFMCITPFDETNSLPFTYLGSAGMFMAIIVGLVVGYFVSYMYKKNWTIKLPKEVPDFVSKSFSAIVPATVVGFAFMIVSLIFSKTPYGDIHTTFYEILKAPMSFLTGNIFGMLFYSILARVFWFFGIHGGMVVMPIAMLFIPARLENLEAFSAGLELPNLITGVALNIAGTTLACVIAILLFTRSKTLRSVAKVGFVPSFFAIDEPVMFGLPIILNPIMFIPLLLTGFIPVVFTYVLELIGFLPYASGVFLSQFLPSFIINFLSFGVSGVIWGLVCFALCVLGYMPFIKILDKQYLEREKNNSAVDQSDQPVQ